jgi:hypothetical protein
MSTTVICAKKMALSGTAIRSNEERGTIGLARRQVESREWDRKGVSA